MPDRRCVVIEGLAGSLVSYQAGADKAEQFNLSYLGALNLWILH
jgi:hypothetical protein